MADRSPVRDLLRIAGPVALARLGIIGMAITDVVVVGQLAPEELAHQALGLAPMSVLVVAGVGLLNGVQVLAARALGAGNPNEAGAAFKRGLIVAIIAGLIGTAALWIGGGRLFEAFGIAPELAAPSGAVTQVFALSIPFILAFIAQSYFMEAIKRPGAASLIMWLGNGVNLALNLLWVPEHGAIGSAWATFGSRIFLFVVLGFAMWRLSDRAQFGLNTLKLESANPSYGALLRVGAAAAVSQAAESGAFAGMTVIAGRIGAEAVAAYQILLNIAALVFMTSIGVGSAGAVLTAEAMGRAAPQDAARSGWTALQINTISMIVFALVLLIAPGPIARGFSAEPTIVAATIAAMWVVALMLIPDGAQVVMASALRARGDNWFPTASHVLAYALVMPALGFWLGETQGLGVAGLFWAIVWSSIISAGILIARWWVLARSPIPG
jgi:MATE family multidrug resistance protein